MKKVLSNSRINLIIVLLMISILVSPGTGKAEPGALFETAMGNYYVQLFDQAAPGTVSNFLTYVRNGDYDNTFIHRNTPGFVAQGGGYYREDNPDGTDDWKYFYPDVVSYGTINNEPLLSNERGTIAMAKVDPRYDEDDELIVGTGPDSATNQWFFNVVDNVFLNNTNGGFTVFGKVLGDGMNVVDAINGLIPYPLSPSLGGSFDGVPLRDYSFEVLPTKDNLVMVNSVKEVNIIAFMSDYTDVYLSFIVQAGIGLGVRDYDPAGFVVSELINDPTFPGQKIINFVQGIQDIGVGTSGAIAVTILVSSDRPIPNAYLVYGPTPDEPTDHWYEFEYDGETGVVIDGRTVTLYLVDGKRGDADGLVNGDIVVGQGGPVFVTALDIDSEGNVDASPAGCALSQQQHTIRNSGGWVLILLFLVILRLKSYCQHFGGLGP